MRLKALELRDEATFIPIIAVDMNPGNHDQAYLLRRCGYPCDEEPNIAIARLRADAGDRFCNDPHYWNDRTFTTAHFWIIRKWNELQDGDVVDVQWILGETPERKISERHSLHGY